MIDVKFARVIVQWQWSTQPNGKTRKHTTQEEQGKQLRAENENRDERNGYEKKGEIIMSEPRSVFVMNNSTNINISQNGS